MIPKKFFDFDFCTPPPSPVPGYFFVAEGRGGFFAYSRRRLGVRVAP